jgi:hypothetical protein
VCNRLASSVFGDEKVFLLQAPDNSRSVLPENEGIDGNQIDIGLDDVRYFDVRYFTVGFWRAWSYSSFACLS